jgi:hypothetical protein
MPTLVHDPKTNDAAGHNTAFWIDDGQKYAVIALSVKLDDPRHPPGAIARKGNRPRAGG